MIPLTLLLFALRYASLTEFIVLLVAVGFVLEGPFSTTVLIGQEYLPARVGLASGITYGLAIGLGGMVASGLGAFAGSRGIGSVIGRCSSRPTLVKSPRLMGFLTRSVSRSCEGPAIESKIRTAIRVPTRVSRRVGTEACQLRRSADDDTDMALFASTKAWIDPQRSASVDVYTRRSTSPGPSSPGSQRLWVSLPSERRRRVSAPARGDEQVLRHARAATRFHARAYIGARHGFATACVPGAVTNHGSISVEIVAASLMHG
jgi:hypothetical protein